MNEEELNEEALVPDISDTSLNTSTAVDQNESHLDASLGLAVVLFIIKVGSVMNILAVISLLMLQNI